METRQSRDRDDRGVVAIEFMLVISMLVVIFLLMLQYAVRAHAERIAAAAAEEGLAAASSYDGSAAEGERAAGDYLSRLTPGLTAATVEASRDPTTATVTVRGQVEQLIPFLPVAVRVHVEGPVERFVPATGGTP